MFDNVVTFVWRPCVFVGILLYQRGNIYSVDEGRRDSWTKQLRAHIDNLRGGKGESGEKFSYRLIGSAVADVHHILVREGTR